MHANRLHSSQELVLHQINVDQGYRGRDADVLTFPGSPQSPQLSLTGGADGTARASGVFPAGSPIAQTPGGSSSTATAAIVRPDVRHRAEWKTALENDVEPFHLSGDVFLLARREGARVPVRYIADDYDRQWLAQRLEEYGADLGVDAGRGGKTGVRGTAPPPSAHEGGGAVAEKRGIGISLFEDIITAFELAAYDHTEIPLERLGSVVDMYLEDVPTTPAITNDVRQYWLRKREALGGNIPCIPALKMQVREDNQNALCRADILGDCPLPFKWRDWTVSTVNRKRARDLGHKKLASGTCLSAEESQLRFAENALKMCVEVLQREQLRSEHTQLALYELASLRDLARHTGNDTKENS